MCTRLFEFLFDFLKRNRTTNPLIIFDNSVSNTTFSSVDIYNLNLSSSFIYQYVKQWPGPVMGSSISRVGSNFDWTYTYLYADISKYT